MATATLPYLSPLVSPASPLFQHPHWNIPVSDMNSRHSQATPPNSKYRDTLPVDFADNQDVLIAVMGATGSGKTTFINSVSGSKLRVGRGLQSCTDTIQPAKPFELDGRTVTLIDTPGFDDTAKSDADVLKMIAAFLAATASELSIDPGLRYEQGMKLSGVVYLHRISDNRMGGISTRNFRMFRQLCGDSSLKNVVIATNMWGLVDEDVAEEREAELAGHDAFFKPVLEKGAQLARHLNTTGSGHDVLRRIINNNPLPLRIQRELIDEGIDITKTAAGAELNRELWKQVLKHRQEIKQIQQEMREAIRMKDEETKRELEQETSRLQHEMRKIQNDSMQLKFHYGQEKMRLEGRLQQIADAARQETAQVASTYQRQIQELHDRLHTTISTSSLEKEEILRRLNEIQMSRRSSAREGVFVMIGRALDMMLSSRFG
ncbi:hypothetical protein BDN72DRAFT_956009 [Pluteus cervinus]|uniref:Uncharacterized protein n=1 Tax=Pluteus cervinus TaxID=181527 RepID=A0ACD3B8K8_9AGAR|nr:hypothetical protein BDN72DRAFT_956009 [Pluteus cervinus]